MAKARDIQQNLLPSRIEIPNLAIAHLFQPADDVGGDYYDAIPLRDGTWLICVAGHGVAAAMSAAMLKTLLMQAAEESNSPAAILEFVNRWFGAVSADGNFVSMILVRFLPQASAVEYASAGHEPALLLSSVGATHECPSTGMLVGVLEQTSWEHRTVDLTDAHRLLMFTDGVSETSNPKGEMFGRKRLAALFSGCLQLSPEQTAGRISDNLKSYRGNKPQHDDITVVVVDFLHR